MNNNVQQVQGSILVIPNFTLCADLKKGYRPSFDLAAAPQVAKPIVEDLVQALSHQYPHIQSGSFGSHMAVSLTHDGPVSLILESPTGVSG